MWTPSGLTIGRLRVQRGGGTDADPSRAAELAVGLLDPRPASLARGATLCVRHLRDPAPGRLPLGLRHGREATAWRTFVETALADLATQAARPADGPVPAGAVAVLFRDDVELLACLAADWSQPGGRANWWWQRVARPPFDGAVARAWLSQIPAVPAVVDRLARRRELRRAVTAIDDSDVLVLVAALASAHGVSLPPSWRARSPLRFDGASAATSQPLFPGGAPTPRGRRLPGRRAPVVPPWAGLKHDLIGLDRSRTLLAGLALTLHRSPGVARSPAFVGAIDAWLRDMGPARATRAVVGRSRTRVPRRQDRGDDLPAEAGGPPARSQRRSRGGSFVTAQAPTGPVVRPRPRAATSEPRHAARRPAAVPPMIAPDPIAESPAAAAVLARRIDTRLGGVFFLLDFALYLGLYGDFSQPEEPGIGLDPWDFLTLLAGDLGLREELEADALGELLRDLAGRHSRSRPGATWRPDPDWRVPSDWLGPFAGVPGPWRWSAARRRLRVDHPAGFPVVDIPIAGRPRAAGVWQALPSTPGPPVLRRAALPTMRAAGRRAVDRWIARLGAYARARLRLALGLDGAADLTAFLLRLPASVSTTATELDVDFQLGHLPIEVRIAGLDRDPGWIPAARRSVRFHFR